MSRLPGRSTRSSVLRMRRAHEQSGRSEVSPRLRDWEELLREYGAVHAINQRTELSWYAAHPSLTSAVIAAANASNAFGSRSDHQRRIQKRAIAIAKYSLLKKKRMLASAKSFHQLHQIISAAVGPIFGIGELYCYDTAVRIGAFRGLVPDRVYLHAGTRRAREHSV